MLIKCSNTSKQRNSKYVVWKYRTPVSKILNLSLSKFASMFSSVIRLRRQHKVPGLKLKLRPDQRGNVSEKLFFLEKEYKLCFSRWKYYCFPHWNHHLPTSGKTIIVKSNKIFFNNREDRSSLVENRLV